MRPRSPSFIHLFKNLDLNLKHLNPESRASVCVCECVCARAACTVSVQIHTWAITVWLLLHWPLSPILQVHWLVPARPKITHIDLPRRRVYSPAITAVPQNHRRPFSFFPLVSCHYLCEVFAAVLCEHERMFLCAFMTSRQKQKKKDENFTSWQFDGYCFFCHPVQEQTKVINALCELISVLCKTKQYRIVKYFWMFCKGPHDIYVSCFFFLNSLV